MYSLSVVAIAREEHLYLEEWLNMARAVGVEHFYIYDNESAIPVKTALQKYVDAGLVDVIPWRGRGNQMLAYSHAIQTYGKNNKWIAVIDIDEYLIPLKTDTVQEVLTDYEDYGALAVSWMIYGSNGHLTKPDGYVVENYTLVMPKDHYENTHTKAIVQPSRVLCWGSNPHFAQYKHPYYGVSEDYKLLVNAWTPHCSNKIQCNHYVLKSLAEYEERMKLPRADVPDPSLRGRSLEKFHSFDKQCTIEDKCALRFVDKMKSLYL